MIKAEYTYKGKELRPKLQEKLKLLQELLSSKEKELESISALDVPYRPQNPMMEMMKIEALTDNDDDPKAKQATLKSVIAETKYQINKCKVLISECDREPRRKFVLDFDEVYWLTF